ncbi:MAG: hypothetical protein M3N46_13330 [Actinomycetota bacterium]|nr:hypothetical protein [Actinomycetota bacterium]
MTPPYPRFDRLALAAGSEGIDYLTVNLSETPTIAAFTPSLVLHASINLSEGSVAVRVASRRTLVAVTLTGGPNYVPRMDRPVTLTVEYPELRFQVPGDAEPTPGNAAAVTALWLSLSADLRG